MERAALVGAAAAAFSSIAGYLLSPSLFTNDHGVSPLADTGVLLAVVMLGARSVQHVRLAGAAAWACLLIGAASLSSPAWAKADPRPLAGLTLLALSVATLTPASLASRLPRVRTSIALLLALAGLNGVALHASPASAHSWAVMAMSPQMAVASLLLAVALFEGERHAGQVSLASLLTYGLPFLVAGASLTMSLRLRDSERHGVRTETASELARLAIGIEERHQLQVQAVLRMQHRLQDAQEPSLQSWTDDAARIVADSGGSINSLVLSDADGSVRRAVPTELTSLLTQPGFLEQPERRAVRHQAMVTRGPAMTPPMQLAGGHIGFTMVTPILRPNEPSGYLAASFNLRRTAERLIAESRYAIRLLSGPHLVATGAEAHVDRGLCAARDVVLSTITLRAVACPTAEIVNAGLTWLPVGTAIRGVTLAGLTGFLAWSLGRSREQTARLRALLLERDAAKADQHRATQQFELLFQNAPLGLILWDDTGQAVIANRAALDLLGINEAALETLSLQALMDPALFVIQRESLEALGVFQGAETALLTPSGTAVDVVISAAVLPGLERKCVCSFVVDNTVAALARRDRETHLEELERQAEALAKARIAADEATQAKSRFLAAMSHEIRTPMNGVLGMLQLLREAPLSEEHAHYLSTASASADSLLMLLNDILDLSKVESGKLELVIAPFDLCETLETVADLFAGRAFTKGLAFAVDLDTGLRGEVRGDAGRVRQIVSNLLSNAVKFTASGTITLSATRREHGVQIVVMDTGIGIPTTAQERLFKPFSQANAQIASRFGGTGLGLAISSQLAALMGGHVSVRSEAGHGSAFTVILPLPVSSTRAPEPRLEGEVVCLVAHPEERTALVRQLGALVNAVFSIERQGDPLAALNERRGKATLLAILAEADTDAWSALSEWAAAHDVPLVRLHRAGHGATGRPSDKTLEMPVRFAALRRVLRGVQAAPTELTPHSPAIPSEPGLRVLVVDDVEVNRLVAQRLAEKLGHQVFVSEGGQAALDLLARQPIDIVLMDCHMPELDGYETTRRIRARYGTALRVIALTASVSDDDRQLCWDAGMDGFLSKPFRLQALQQLLSKTSTSPPHPQASAPVGVSRIEPAPP